MRGTGIFKPVGLKIKTPAPDKPLALPKKKRDNPEERLQQAVTDFLRVSLVGIYWHNVNENKLLGLIPQAYRENILKKLGRLGMKSGVLDITIHWFAKEYGHPRTLYIELKRPANGKTRGGETSEAQDKMIADLNGLGIPCAVCRSLDEVQAVLEYYNVPLKGVLT